jgi:hypothetical protein
VTHCARDRVFLNTLYANSMLYLYLDFYDVYVCMYVCILSILMKFLEKLNFFNFYNNTTRIKYDKIKRKAISR